MMKSATSKLTQTTLNAYFNCTKEPTEINKKLRKTRHNMSAQNTSRKPRRKLISSNQSTTEDSMMMSSQSSSIQITEKRNIKVQIFSEDEDEEENNESHPNRTTRGKKKTVGRSSVTISLNRPTVIHSPKKVRAPRWAPMVTSTPLTSVSPCSNASNITASSISRISEEPSCSKSVNERSTLLASQIENVKPRNKRNKRSETDSESCSSNEDNKTVIEKSSKKAQSLTPKKKRKIVQNSGEESTPKKKSVKKAVEPSSSVLKDESEESDKKANFFYRKVFLEFIEKIWSSHHLRVLIKSDEPMIANFIKASKEAQFICVKLFMRQRTWYGISKLCDNYKLRLEREEVMRVYNELKDNSFVFTDISGTELSTLLNNLDKPQLCRIHRELNFKGFGHAKKETLISKLIEFCNTQCTLTQLKSMEQILRELIKNEMGFSVFLNPELDGCLFRIYLLNTFANSLFNEPKDFFKNIGVNNMVFPSYQVEKYVVFYTPEEFKDYADAVMCRNALDRCVLEGNRVPYVFEICQSAFQHLKKIINSHQTETPRPVYLRKFLAANCYAEVLTSGASQLTLKYTRNVQTWMEYLLSLDICPHRRSSWINTLALIHGHYNKHPNIAVEIICEALEKRDSFTNFQICELAQKAEVYARNKSISPMNLDRLAALSPRVNRNWPSIILDRKQIHGRFKNEVRYEVDEDGEKSYLSVEQVALRYYLEEEEFTKGDHYENWTLSTLFCVLFWDIIYHTYVKGTFVADYQSAPLDLKSDQFYSNRKCAIDQRLKEIESDWTTVQIESHITKIFENHSHETGVSRLDVYNFTPVLLIEIVDCIGRQVLAKILKRLIVDYRFHGSGFPDLFVWNSETKNCKFVEVKSENDVLSLKQKLWLNHLDDSGANVEVCHVHSIGMKKKAISKKIASKIQ